MQIIGQSKNLDIINKWKYIPNFIIVQGEHNYGKTYFILNLCDKFKLGYLKVNNAVKDVRDLINIMKPNSNMVYHFKDFDTASTNAKNALLKITEEPIPGNYIIISGGPQIDTLKSRARIILMDPYTIDECYNYMDNINIKKDIQQKLYYAGLNTPSKIKFYNQYEDLERLIDYANKIFERITYINPIDIFELVNMFQNRYEIGKPDPVLLFLNILINDIQYSLEHKMYFSYMNILSILIEGRNKLQNDNTLRRKMLLYNIFYNIYNTEIINQNGGI